MADERDPEVSRRYRELGREEPPGALDEAILAAARSELETRPAPLVAPTARRHWFVPLAAAAVIVLSVVVTLQVQREQPDVEGAPPAPATVPPPPAAPPVPAASKLERAAKPFPGAGETTAGPAAESRAARPALQRQAAGAAASDATAELAEEAESPERTLERIAKLREEGRHREADDLYAEFKRRFPDYRIPKELLPRVEPR